MNKIEVRLEETGDEAFSLIMKESDEGPEVAVASIKRLINSKWSVFIPAEDGEEPTEYTCLRYDHAIVGAVRDSDIPKSEKGRVFAELTSDRCQKCGSEDLFAISEGFWCIWCRSCGEYADLD